MAGENIPKSEPLVTSEDCAIEGVKIPAGTLVGHREPGGKLKSAHKVVEVGHLAARLADGRVIPQSQYRRIMGSAKPAEGMGSQEAAKSDAGK